MGTHPLCPGEDSTTHILQNCHGERKKEIKKEREKREGEINIWERSGYK
jgi:hypothetical protein